MQIELLSLKDPPQPVLEPAPPATVLHTDEEVVRVYEGLAAARQALSLAAGGDAGAAVDVSDEASGKEAAQNLQEAAVEAMAKGSAVFAFPGSAGLSIYPWTLYPRP